jgi:hypothetical protein
MEKRFFRLKCSLIATSLIFSCGAISAYANIPPVRISVVAANGDGNEQQVVDRIIAELERSPDIIVSTINSDWFVKCSIKEINDQRSGQIRYNGTVTVTTADGQTINTTSVQKYNQDFSLQREEPLNKALVEGAAHRCVDEMSSRALEPIEDAVHTEMRTREMVLKATKLGDGGEYDQAIALLQQITPDSTHYWQVRALITRYRQAKILHAHTRRAQAR